MMLTLLLSCGGDFADPDRALGPEVAADVPLHPVTIHEPTTLGLADVPALTDGRGAPVGVRCATCHGPTPDEAWVAREDAPEDLHAAITVRHGTLTCAHCHDVDDPTQLHLADGSPLELGDAMTLCAQCHGVQHRDYRRGSHGGMTGHWDLRRGGRDRNHCVDCHAPHDPAYGQVMPVHPPRDRFLHAGDQEH